MMEMIGCNFLNRIQVHTHNMGIVYMYSNVNPHCSWRLSNSSFSWLDNTVMYAVSTGLDLKSGPVVFTMS